MGGLEEFGQLDLGYGREVKQEEEDEIVVVEDCVDPIEHRINECGRLGLPVPPRPELWDLGDGKKRKR